MEQMEAERLKRMDKGKSDSAAETEKATRNQAKLGNAEETYQDLRDKVLCNPAHMFLGIVTGYHVLRHKITHHQTIKSAFIQSCNYS